MLSNDIDMKTLLAQAKTIAVLGAKDKAGQPVDMVGRYLVQAGYTVVPVHPMRQNVWGLTTYAQLADIPFAVDIVDVFRAPQHCAGHAREVLQLASLPRCFWMQQGIASPEARTLLEDAGVIVVENKCLKVEHARLLP